MEANDIEVSPLGIFEFYKDLADHYYFDSRDKNEFNEKLLAVAAENKKEIFFEDIIFDTKEKQIAFSSKIVRKYS